MDFENVCRLCLSENDGTQFQTTLYESDGPTQLSRSLESLNISLMKADHLPNNVCDACSQTVKDFMSFKKLIAKNETILKEISENVDKNKTDFDAKYNAGGHVVFDHCYNLIEYFKEEKVEATGRNSNIEVAVESEKNIKQNTSIKTEISCVLCTKNFYSAVDYDLHLYLHVIIQDEQFEMKMFCMYCGEVFYDENVRESHINESHSHMSNVFVCVQCNSLHETELDLLKHEKIEQHYSVDHIEGIDCVFCQPITRFDDFETFFEHCKKHVQKEYPCRLCSSKFISITTLLHHRLIVHGKKGSKYLKESFTESEGLSQFEYVHPDRKQQVCDICGKLFESRSGFAKHVLQHNIKKNKLKCYACQYSTFHKSDLKKHERTHTNEKPFKCTFAGCGTAYSTQSNLQAHKRRHLNIKFKCDHCNNSFSSSYSLKLHLTTHTGEKKFVCGICTKKFSRSEYLRSHMKYTHQLTKCIKLGVP